MVIDTLRVWNALYLVIDVDPRIAPGVQAGSNSLAIDIDGLVYQKTGPLDTDWTLVVVPSGGSILNNYASFYDTSIQTNLLPVNLCSFDSTSLSKGVNVVSGSQITFANAGIYDIQFSAQIEKSGGNPSDIEIWLRKMGADIPWTNTALNVQGNNQKFVAAWNFFEVVTAGQYLEIAWFSNEPSMSLVSRPAQIAPVRPEIPSIILTVNQVSA